MSTGPERAALRFLTQAPLLHADMIAMVTGGDAEIFSVGERIGARGIAAEPHACEGPRAVFPD